MWKISRNLVFSRWPLKKPKNVENNSTNVPYPKPLASTVHFENKQYSDQSHQKKRSFHKHQNRFWDSPEFKFLLSKSLLFETAGWLGTMTVLCFNLHFKHFHSLREHARANNHCLFSRAVLAMPQGSSQQENGKSGVPILQNHPMAHLKLIHEDMKRPKVISDPKVFGDVRITSSHYDAAVQNSTGLSYLDTNNKKAFRHFQTAARLGSTQGFYNLGLCYELGKGTKINLSRAAFCYKKAALKGHGLACFNLAIYFLRGLGGLPVNHEMAKQLLEEAAEQNITEALLYLGLEYLEEGKFLEAYEQFSTLSQKDIPEGKYYLGLCYENGWGVNKDEKMAAEIFSQTAFLGHPKSILSLSRYYEEGLGGCKSDLDFALALCQILADKGDEEGKQALSRLKIKQENMRLLDSFETKLPPLRSRRITIRISSSVPELTSDKSSSKSSIFSTNSYLNLVSLFPTTKTTKPSINEKVEFCIGGDKLKLNLSPCLQSTIIPVVTAKT